MGNAVEQEGAQINAEKELLPAVMGCLALPPDLMLPNHKQI
jgi:hypothetical protein